MCRFPRHRRQGIRNLLVTTTILALGWDYCAATAAANARTEARSLHGAVEAAFLHPRPWAPSEAQLVAGACGDPEIVLTAEAGGLTQISVGSSCRAGELVSVSYAEATFVERLDPEGHSAMVLDCFAGDSAPITIAFEDGTSVVRQPVPDDLARYSKVAILWSSSVDLDLHAFEYAAAAADAGHVWSGRPLSFAEAETNARNDRRGHGFLSTAGAGNSIGMNVEVYTFVHYPHEKPAGVKMGVDFVTRGDRAAGEYCGAGRYAEIHFKAYVIEKGRPSRQLDLAFAGVPCGTDINDAVRINSRLIPELTIRE
jgi:hypothetical protein